MGSIFKQASWVIAAQFFTRVISLFYVVFLAKNLGVSDYGLYTIALVYFSLISAVADFGFTRFLIREVAMKKEKIPDLVCNVSLFRLTITSFLFAIFAVFLYLLDPDKFRVSLSLLAVLAVIPQVLGQTFDAIFIALQKLNLSALSLLVTNIITVVLGVILLNLGFGVMGAVNALIGGQVIFVFISLFLLLKGNPHAIFSKVNFKTLMDISKGSLPYGLLTVLGLLYFRIDALMLSYMKGSFETGLYGVAFKFLEAIVFIPGSLGIAIFPITARLHDSNPGQIKQLYFKSIKVMFLISIIIATGFIFILPFFIALILPNYLSSIAIIRVLALAIPFMFIHVPGAQVLLSSERYIKPVILLSLFTLMFNVITNFFFIPLYGALGAAWTTVASEILSFVLLFQLLRQKVFK